MSASTNTSKPGRRAARVVLGSLATGALLSAAPAVMAATPASVQHQFDQAFTPGAADLTGPGGRAIVVDAS